MFSQGPCSFRSMSKLFAGLLIMNLILINLLLVHAQAMSNTSDHSVSFEQAGEPKVVLPQVSNSSQTSIQTITGNYLTAVDGGGRLTDAIHTDATSIREWERFKLIPLGDDWYAIQTFAGNYVTAVDGGGRLTDVIHTDATSIQEWEKFRLVNQGYQVFLPLIFW